MWSVFSNALSVMACLLSAGALFYAVRAAALALELQDQLSVSPVSRMKSLETSLQEQADALAEVANRVKMMKVRNAANHTGAKTSLPDPYRSPDEWRKAMNQRLAAARLGPGNFDSE